MLCRCAKQVGRWLLCWMLRSSECEGVVVRAALVQQRTLHAVAATASFILNHAACFNLLLQAEIAKVTV